MHLSCEFRGHFPFLCMTTRRSKVDLWHKPNRQSRRPWSAAPWSPSEETERIRETARAGRAYRAYGGPDFVDQLERKLGRVLRPDKRDPKSKRWRVKEMPRNAQLINSLTP